MKQKKFPRINLQKLTHSQLRMVLKRILKSWSDRENIPTTIALLLADIQPLLNTMDAILVQEQASSHTKEVRAADDLRDRAYRLLLKKIGDAALEFDASLVEAGEQLRPVVNRFRTSITRSSYSEQTSSMRLVIHEFREPNSFSAITTLGLIPHLDRVEALNEAFEVKWNERAVETASKENLPLLSSVRTALEKTLRLLLKVSAYLYSKKHDSIDDQLFNCIENELTAVGSVIKMRETLSQNDQE